MKTKKIIVGTFLMMLAGVGLFSCVGYREKEEVKIIDYHSMTDILNNCKGHAVVTAKGYNSGNFDSRQYYLIIRDDSMNCFEYVGSNYDVAVGDTLK